MHTRVISHTDETTSHRHADYDILPLILNRWSPRAMTGESLHDDEIFPLFEAARWAPSSFNGQPWRFIVARREKVTDFDSFLHMLVPQNAAWAKDAAALVVVAARRTFERNNRPSRTHVLDTGAAWENLALEAARRGLVAHGMEGFDYERAQRELSIPPEFEVVAMIAIGRRARIRTMKRRTASTCSGRSASSGIALGPITR